MALVERLNQNPAVNGILVQLPLPRQIDPAAVIATIDPATMKITELIIDVSTRASPCDAT